MSSDLAELARRLGRAEFIARCTTPVLAGSNALTEPPRPVLQTMLNHKIDWSDLTRVDPATRPTPPVPRPPELLIYALRKVQPIFPNMITVGRTPNNDIVISDTSVSKFHAFFQPTPEPGRFSLCDAGSTNGSFVDERGIPKDGASIVAPGMRIRFGNVAFLLLDAGGCWDFVRRT